MRIGFGYDVHPFAENRKLILGGVDISFTKGLLGHSDADALCHAIGDALLGAAALGDIGKHFPDNDPQYKGISSIRLLEKIRALLQTNGYEIVNIDSTIALEAPKVASYIEQMCENLSSALNLASSDISVKATTTEKLGFVGKGEGIAVYAVALIEKSS
ncbi:MAG: 2-C-methyl-D-erythritol 2,4-cyclodiphosphate synthase [Bacteroidota bacterium]|nr:2-C-methyl-D-erythritol 2,4-cyclodiphosphate synthase [Bacteroidota bacterium]